MRSLLKTIILLLILLNSANTVPLNAKILFPDRCVGVWEGTMIIYKHTVIENRVKVRFTVARIPGQNQWTWKTEYLSKKRPMIKDFILRLVDEEKKRYVTDERNGIELETSQLGDKLFYIFEIGGALLTSSYQFIGENLVFELTYSKKLEKTNKHVTNYSVTNLQRVILKKRPTS